ncbi:MAG: cysteine desulfurase family protein [candidate division KSB1 bacterium]|nr:cysteine desulfurase family protein [candidate division KSB1 bacterium]
MFGNPSSSHWYGIQARKAVETARKQVAALLNCDADEIVFTSGGSESNNLTIKGIAWSLQSRGKHIITSAIEHPAVMQVCRYLQNEGYEVTYVPVDEYGRVDPHDVETAIRPGTTISIMHANNEVGTIQPIADIADMAHQHDIVMHTDAAQSVGKIPVRVSELKIDLLSLAGHKCYAPKGVGALYIKRGTRLQKQIHGADHEHNLRAGTENVPEIVGLGRACELIQEDGEPESERLREWRDLLQTGLQERIANMRVNGHPEFRLANTLNVSFLNVEANTVLDQLNSIAASAGAACHADEVAVSPVLKAMGVPTEWAMGTIRLSVGRMTTRDQVNTAIQEMDRYGESASGAGDCH